MRLCLSPARWIRSDAVRWLAFPFGIALLTAACLWLPTHVAKRTRHAIPTFAETFKPTMVRARSDVEADQVWSLPDADGHGLTGRGMVICDIDGAIDVFHPMFFKADGGMFSWLDVDRDGAWSPGDAVDMDADGFVGLGERLGWLPMTGYYPPDRDTTRFQAGYDFLFQDANENDTRDFGPPAFKEQDPCYGERLFLAADENENGRLDPDEALVGLKTSKIRAIYDGIIYRRGTDLIDYPGGSQIEHGTAVCGILAGGWSKWHRMSGIAPDAELLVAVGGDLESLTWANEEGADVALYEWAGHISDGSNSLESLVDAVSAQGMIFVSPAGNERLTLQHVTLVGGSEECLLNDRFGGIYVDFVWKGPSRPLLRMRGPEGAVLELTPSQEDVQVEAGGLWASGSLWETARGTCFWSVRLGSRERSLAFEPWFFSFPGWDGEVHGFSEHHAPEDSSGWLHDDGKCTVTYPGTADSSITVAAYVNEPFAEMAWFSGAGPRVDGRPDVTIAAPGVRVWTTMPGGANFGRLSGTSIAIPFVAGAAALLKQAFPDMDSGLFRSLITQGAGKDSLTGDPDRWGAGRLRIRQSLVAGLERNARLVGPSRLPIHASPNPLRAETYLSWQSGVTGDAEVNIYSVDGRLVWDTVSAPSGGRVSSVRWDGRDQRGAMCSQGVYFAHVREGSRIGTARLVLLR